MNAQSNTYASCTEREFKAAIAAAGWTPPDTIIADGKLHRFATNGKAHDAAGWYILHGDNVPAGSFGNWRDGHTQTWCGVNPGKFSAAERQQYAAVAEARRRENLAAEIERHKIRAADFREWAAPSTEAVNQNYLFEKKLPGHGLRQLGGLLIAPLLDECGTVWGGQTINGSGQKRFFTGARKQGLFCPIGWQVGEPITELLLAEGWGTACAAHLMFQLPAAAAMDAGNLQPAAKTIRKRYPAVKLIFCADWDGHAGGVGMTSACEAAHAVGNAKVIKPECADDAHHDFADSWLELRGAK